MDARADSFLEDFSPLSQALIGAQNDRREQNVSASSFFITIENERCFRCFDSALMRGMGMLEYHLLWMKFAESFLFAMFVY